MGVEIPEEALLVLLRLPEWFVADGRIHAEPLQLLQDLLHSPVNVLGVFLDLRTIVAVDGRRSRSGLGEKSRR